mgnify:CR=1 FL=1
MIKISLNKGFTLPRLGKEAFAKLMRSGVEYDKTRGLFTIKDASKIDSIVAIIRESTHDTISIELECIICGKDAGCNECEFSNNCNRLQVSNRCICKDCMLKGYDNYIKHIRLLTRIDNLV